MYVLFVLFPSTYGLNTAGRKCQLSNCLPHMNHVLLKIAFN